MKFSIKGFFSKCDQIRSLNSLFLLYANLRAIKIYSEIKLQTTCFYQI